MSRLISCRNCDSPYCDGCNIKILEESLKIGLLNKFMNEHHLIIKEKIVDAVPVVRCKDCKNMEKRELGRFCTAWDKYNGHGDNGWCCYGERRAEA